MKFTSADFEKRFPSEEFCLEEIKYRKYGEGYRCSMCDRCRWYRVKGRPVYACACGHQINPLANTIFHKSTTPLKTWLQVMFIMSQNKAGMSAMYIERTIELSYPTALRMMRQIRKTMVSDDILVGDIEVDETFFKPKPYRDSRVRQVGRGPGAGAQILMGMAERGGQVRVKHIPNTGAATIRKVLKNCVAPGSTLHTDAASHYIATPRYGYKHASYQHYKGEYEPGKLNFQPVEGNSTQQIENFWRQFKRSFEGVYRKCSPEYLELYAAEYAFRYSNRNSEVPLFDLMLDKVCL